MMIDLLAPYMLSVLLLELLEKSRSAYVATVSSAADKMGRKPVFDDKTERNYSMSKVYGLSKLYIIRITSSLIS